jgi:hypothetical protein
MQPHSHHPHHLLNQPREGKSVAVANQCTRIGLFALFPTWLWPGVIMQAALPLHFGRGSVTATWLIYRTVICRAVLLKWKYFGSLHRRVTSSAGVLCIMVCLHGVTRLTLHERKANGCTFARGTRLRQLLFGFDKEIVSLTEVRRN